MGKSKRKDVPASGTGEALEHAVPPVKRVKLLEDSDEEDDKTSATTNSDADSEEVAKLIVNDKNAAKQMHEQERAELHRLQQKYKNKQLDEDDDESSSEDETEDEDGEQVTADVDAAILKTLAKIKRKDEDIYNAESRVFDEVRAQVANLPAPPKQNRTSSSKKVTLQDYQRQRIQDLIINSEKTGQDAARALADETTNPERMGYTIDYEAGPSVRSHAQEEQDLRKEVLAAFHEDDEDGGDDNLFVQKGDTQQNNVSEEHSYRDYLLQALGKDEEAVRETLREEAKAAENIISDLNTQSEKPADKSEKSKATKASSSSGQKESSQEEKNEQFLMNYILNRGWVEPEVGSAVEKRKKMMADAKEKASQAAKKKSKATKGEDEEGGEQVSGGRDWDAEAAELSSEASFDSRAEAFENAYNFRYEAIESGAAPGTISTYSRDAAAVNSVRRPSDRESKRKEKREERRARKEQEKEDKMRDLDRLKQLKRKDIVEKLKLLREATGSNAIGFEDVDLEGDFDPEAHDQAMEGAFNDQYYEEEEDVQFDADGKPIWNDDIDIDDILVEEEALAGKGKKKDKGKRKAAGADDERMEMDADFLEDDNGGLEDDKVDLSTLSKKERKKLKKKQKKQKEQEAKRRQAAGGQTEGGAGEEGGVNFDDMNAEQKPLSVEEIQSMAPEERKKKVGDMVDNYYAMDYEDMIGDLPTRFKYLPVSKSNYGLSPVEILLADDAQLNNVVGLKNMQPYRRGPKKPADLNRRLHEFRRELTQGSGAGTHGQERSNAPQRGTAGAGGEDGKAKKRMGKKERKKLKRAAEQGELADGSEAPSAKKARTE